MPRGVSRLFALTMFLVFSTAPASPLISVGAWTVAVPAEAAGNLTRSYMYTSSDTSYTLIFQCSESFLNFGLDIIVHGPNALKTFNGNTNVLVRYPVRNGYRDLSGLDEWDVGWDGRAAFAPVGVTPALRSVLPALDTLEVTLTYAEGTKEVHAFQVTGFDEALEVLECPRPVRPGQADGDAS